MDCGLGSRWGMVKLVGLRVRRRHQSIRRHAGLGALDWGARQVSDAARTVTSRRAGTGKQTIVATDVDALESRRGQASAAV